MHQTFLKLFKFVSTFLTIGDNESYTFSYVHRRVYFMFWTFVENLCVLKTHSLIKFSLLFHFEMQQLPNEKNLFIGLHNSWYQVCTPKTLFLVP
jgi:hypothetical protein